ncbi:MAG TPA: hypothetical protein PLJ60_06475 [Chryseolinea sp.]|jgi:hypothetical protein|nr:hypothetical protein [Chryseolinea sp.]HPM29962.1 hypothetical protein [Chryseolinea sp.]
MRLIARIIFWGILLLMLKDANSQPRIEKESTAAVTASPVNR